MSLSWSPQQREWLQALGHPAMVLAGDGSMAGSADPEPLAVPAPDLKSAPAHDLAPVPAPDSSLHRALLRATGLPADQAELALRSMGVNAAALRDDPAAKRKLWASLRRLRKEPSR